MNALLAPIESNDIAELERLLTLRGHGAGEVDDAMLTAIRLNRGEHLRTLLLHGGNLLLKLPESGWSLLHVAVESGAAQCVRALVAAGLAIDTGDSTGMTPLHLAVDGAADAVEQHGGDLDLGMVRLLRELGADPAVRNDAGELALDWAAGREELEALLRS